MHFFLCKCIGVQSHKNRAFACVFLFFPQFHRLLPLQKRKIHFSISYSSLLFQTSFAIDGENEKNRRARPSKRSGSSPKNPQLRQCRSLRSAFCGISCANCSTLFSIISLNSFSVIGRNCKKSGFCRISVLFLLYRDTGCLSTNHL